MRAYKSGIHEETVIFWLREGVETPARYTTDDILERGNISAASVKRAERAQARLVERAQARLVERAQDENLKARAEKIYMENQGEIDYGTCVEMAI